MKHENFMNVAAGFKSSRDAVQAPPNEPINGDNWWQPEDCSLDVFVTKLETSGKLIFTTTLSGKSSDVANAIELDPSGNIYVAGVTSSVDFPLSRAWQSQVATGGSSCGMVHEPAGLITRHENGVDQR